MLYAASNASSACVYCIYVCVMYVCRTFSKVNFPFSQTEVDLASLNGFIAITFLSMIIKILCNHILNCNNCLWMINFIWLVDEMPESYFKEFTFTIYYKYSVTSHFIVFVYLVRNYKLHKSDIVRYQLRYSTKSLRHVTLKCFYANCDEQRVWVAVLLNGLSSITSTTSIINFNQDNNNSSHSY